MAVTEKKNSNSGFSLVELIVVVSILAVASIPLMKSMGLATRTNAKAQSMQNATSLGESVMEEMKSLSIDEIKAKYGPTGMDVLVDNGSSYDIDLGDMTATQGERFAVKVKIDKASYSVTPAASPSKADKVKAANITALPKIEEIDALGQAVISSKKELNRYDTAAQNYFNEKKAGFDPAVASTKANITSKTVDIVKKNAPGAYPGVTVTATITYEDDATPTKNKYVRDLYTGSFVAVNREGSTTEYKPLNSNIYIFYKAGCIPETINITDTSTYRNPLDTTSPDSHRVYFIRQDKTDTTGPTIKMNGGTFTYTNVSSLDESGHKDYSGIWFMTNLSKDDISDEGKVYSEETKIRVYDITVELSKGGEVYSTLNSTVSASDPTPTPTPTPP